MVVARKRLSYRRPELIAPLAAEGRDEARQTSIRRGYKQHRHDLCGSILKINHVYEPLPDNPPSGYRELLIARDDVAVPKPMTDPDGNRVVLMLTSGVIAGITET